MLKSLIKSLPGETWDNKVVECARIIGRSRSTIYQWLSDNPPIPEITLDALIYRIGDKQHVHTNRK